MTRLAAILALASSVWAQERVQLVESPPSARATQGVGTGVIDGTLTAVGTGRPVRRAVVSITGGAPRVAKTTTTDDTGRFSFAQLTAGDFTLSASKAGYLDSTYGQKRPGSGRAGTPIQLAEGQKLDRVSLPIARGGVITGLILDDAGDPAFGVNVRALRYSMQRGERALQPAGSAQTDDRGVYRITSLLPGEYVVMAVPREADPQVGEKMAMEAVATEKMKAVVATGTNREQAIGDIQKMLDQMSAPTADPAKEPASGLAAVYFPGTTTGPSATVVPLDISEEKTNVDLQLQIVPLTRITGVVTSPDGAIPPGTQVLLLDSTQALPGSSPRSARPGPDGKFTFVGVQQGQYTVAARSGGGAMITTGPGGGGGMGPSAATKFFEAAPNNQLWAMTDVFADGRNPASVTLNLQPGLSVSGKLAFDGGVPPAGLSGLRLSLNPVGQGIVNDLASGIRPVGVDIEGRFTFIGVVPGRYRVGLASKLSGWSLRSAVIAGQDTLDIPLDVKGGENPSGALVTLTTRTTDLSGTLQGPAGQPSADFTVVVFASDNRYWLPQSRRTQATRPSTNGRFSFRDLPPGDYRLAAVSDVEPGQWFDPAFLRQLVGASIGVTLGEGERKTQDLRVAK